MFFIRKAEVVPNSGHCRN